MFSQDFSISACTPHLSNAEGSENYSEHGREEVVVLQRPVVYENSADVKQQSEDPEDDGLAVAEGGPSDQSAPLPCVERALQQSTATGNYYSWVRNAKRAKRRTCMCGRTGPSL